MLLDALINYRGRIFLMTRHKLTLLGTRFGGFMRRSRVVEPTVRLLHQQLQAGRLRYKPGNVKSAGRAG